MNKNIDDQLLMDLANQLGMDPGPASAGPARTHTPSGASSVSFNQVSGRTSNSDQQFSDPRQQAMAMAETMKGKSESEILSEIMKVKAQLQKTPGAYEKQIRAVKALRGMMNPEQRKRLDQVLSLLER